MQSGRRENLLTKWIYFLLKKGPPNPRRRHGPNKPPAAPTSYCSPAHARQSPGGGQTTYSLHSGGVSDTDSAGSSPFSRRCLFCVSRPARSSGNPFPRPPAGVPAVCSWQAAGSFFVWNAETARLQLTTVRLCGTITDGKRIWQGKSLGKRRLSPAEGAKLSGGPIGLGLKMDVALEKLIARTEGARRQRRISQVKGQSKEGGPLWASPVFFVLCMSWTAPLRVRLFFCARAPGPARLGNWEKRGKQEDGTNAERYRQCGE